MSGTQEFFETTCACGTSVRVVRVTSGTQVEYMTAELRTVWIDVWRDNEGGGAGLRQVRAWVQHDCPARPTRERLGEVVRDARVTWARETGETRPSHLACWRDCPEDVKECDRRIGEAVMRAVLEPKKE